jgi:hypothetical protein
MDYYPVADRSISGRETAEICQALPLEMKKTGRGRSMIE